MDAVDKSPTIEFLEKSDYHYIPSDLEGNQKGNNSSLGLISRGFHIACYSPHGKSELQRGAVDFWVSK